MATYVARTEIRHGKGKDDVVTFEEGETVTGLNEDELKPLIEAGAVAEKRVVALEEKLSDEKDKLNEELQAKVRELQEKLAEAEAKQKVQQTPTTSGGAPLPTDAQSKQAEKEEKK
jgi:hypothetical protein